MRFAISRLAGLLNLVKRASDARFAPALSRRWPLGPHYWQLSPAGNKNGRPWTALKLAAADWYLAALEEIEHKTLDLDRFVGVEMAMDGFLAAASGAFDAASSGLLDAIERRYNMARQPTWRNWRTAKRVAANVGVTLAVQPAVDNALKWDLTQTPPVPSGWLAQLRELRNRSTHDDTITRAFFRNVGGPQAGQPTKIKVAGIGDADPLRLFRGWLSSTQSLCSAMLTEADAITP